MAQIIKHRRGGIDAIASATAKKGELVMATGSVGQLNGPFIFIGETDGAAGGFRSVSKIYQGSTAPDLSNNNWGTTLNGTPFYSSDDDTLYILGNGGNTAIDLTGNIEGNVIDSVTINNLDGNLNLVGDLMITGDTYQTGSITLTGDVTLRGNINIGDNLTGDTVTLNGEINSSILPAESNTFSLGASGQTWSDVWAENAHFTNISIGDITLDSLELPGNLTVSGTTTLSGSVLVEDLIQGRVVLVGADGQLVDNENFIYDLINGFVMNTSGSVDINTSGSFNLYTHGGNNIYMSSSSNFNVDADNDVNITAGDDVRIYANDIFDLRNYSLDSSIRLTTKYNSGDDKTLEYDINGDLTIPGGFTGSYLDINTQAQLASAAVEDLTDNRIVLAGVGGELEDDVNFTFDGTTFNVGQGNFEVDTDGDIRTSGSLDVNGVTNLRNDVNVTGSLVVSDGSGVFNSSLNVNNSNLTLNNGSNLDVQDGGTLTVSGDATFNQNVYSDYYKSLSNNNNALYFNNNSPSGAASVELWSDDGDLSLYADSGNIRLTGSVHISDDLNLNGGLTANSAIINGNVYVSGNLEILGSATEVHIQSQVVELDDNIIRLNAYSPFERYAGFEVIDSGSTGVSASMVWDSLGDYWMFVSSSGQSSKMIGTTAGTYGSENSLTNNMIPKATGLTTIGDSLLSEDGTTLTYNTNKFTIDSASGDTYINGNVTLNSGGDDSGNKTSGIVFRNDDGVLGFVSTTETTDVLDGILGYKNSDGGLVFSTVIDGGSY